MGRLQEYSTAALRALLYHALVYFFLVHYFVALKWETTEIEELIPIRVINMPYPEPYQPPEESVELTNAKSFLAYIQKRGHQQGIVGSDIANSVLDKFNEFMDEMQSNISHDFSNILPEGSHSMKTNGLIKLLKQSSITSIREPIQLNASLEQAYLELDSMESLRDELQWSQIQETLSGRFSPKEKLTQQDIYQQACVVPPLDDTAEDDELGSSEEDAAKTIEEEEVDTSLWLKEDDLNLEYSVVKGLLKGRRENVQSHLTTKFNDTVATALKDAFGIVGQDLEDAQTYVKEEWKAFQEASEEDEQVSEDNEFLACVAEEDIALLLERAIMAVEKRLDIRNALLNAFAELDPDAAKTLILDADWDTEPPAPDETAIHTINLRHFIDKPVLRHLADGIESILDKFRDYTNNAVDSHIEQLCEKLDPGALAQGISPGEILVDYLLKVSGKAKASVPQQVQQRLLESRKGREVLRSLF